jgi:hypothetical protein
MRWKALCNFAQGNYKNLPAVYQSIIQTIPQQQTPSNTRMVFMRLRDFCLFMKGKIDTISSEDSLIIRHYLDIQEMPLHNPIMATPLTAVVHIPTGMDHLSSMIHMRMPPDSRHGGNHPVGQVPSAALIGSTTHNVPRPYPNEGSRQTMGYNRLDPATNLVAPSLFRTLANETDQWSYSRPVLDPSMVRTSFNPPIPHDGKFYSSWQSPGDPNTLWSTRMTMSGQPYGGYYPPYPPHYHYNNMSGPSSMVQWQQEPHGPIVSGPLPNQMLRYHGAHQTSFGPPINPMAPYDLPRSVMINPVPYPAPFPMSQYGALTDLSSEQMRRQNGVLENPYAMAISGTPAPDGSRN